MYKHSSYFTRIWLSFLLLFCNTPATPFLKLMGQENSSRPYIRIELAVSLFLLLFRSSFDLGLSAATGLSGCHALVWSDSKLQATSGKIAPTYLGSSCLLLWLRFFLFLLVRRFLALLFLCFLGLSNSNFSTYPTMWYAHIPWLCELSWA